MIVSTSYPDDHVFSIGGLIGRLLSRRLLKEQGIPLSTSSFSATQAGKPYIVCFINCFIVTYSSRWHEDRSCKEPMNLWDIISLMITVSSVWSSPQVKTCTRTLPRINLVWTSCDCNHRIANLSRSSSKFSQNR